MVPIGTNASNKRSFWRIQQGYGSNICSESSSTSILCICELWRLWRVWAYVQNRLNLRCSPMRLVPKVSKGAKIRNRYNQVPHLTQYTNGKVTNSQLDTTNESQEVNPFPEGDHKAHINRRAQRHSKHKTKKHIKDPQNSHVLALM